MNSDQVAHTELLERGRDAYEQGSWTQAYQTLSAADDESSLDSEDLERLAVAAQLIAEDEVAAASWERAHLELLRDGRIDRAVRCAFWLASALFSRGEMARGGGWIGRAQRLVEEHRLDGAEPGFLLFSQALARLEQGDPATAHGMCIEVVAAGDRFAEVDLVTLGRLGQGRALVEMGRPTEGLPLLDEAMVAVTTGEVSPVLAGRAYCAVILVCQKAFDFSRAHEWTAALSEWCDRQPDMVPFRGQCLVHRSEVMQWHGSWPDALREAERARERLSAPPGQPAVGMAFYQLGELYRLRGEFDDAEAAFREANRHGREPQPGLASLRLMQGDVDAAAAALRRVMDERLDYVTRSRVLGVCVEVMLEAGDTQTAKAASDELKSIALEVGSPMLEAVALHAAGTILVADGEPRAGRRALRDACAIWSELEAPYELARSRVMVSLACRALGDRDTCEFEADSARQTFRQLGAKPDSERLEALVARDPARTSSELTSRQLEVLTLVATGMSNKEIATELTVSEHTVRRHVQNIFNRIGVSSRSAATAFAYEHGLV